MNAANDMLQVTLRVGCPNFTTQQSLQSSSAAGRMPTYLILSHSGPPVSDSHKASDAKLSPGGEEQGDQHQSQAQQPCGLGHLELINASLAERTKTQRW